MPEPMTNTEIEDVLASIRRLVSEDFRPSRPRPAEVQAARPMTAEPVDGGAKLVLTASQMIAPAAASDAAEQPPRRLHLEPSMNADRLQVEALTSALETAPAPRIRFTAPAREAAIADPTVALAANPEPDQGVVADETMPVETAPADHDSEADERQAALVRASRAFQTSPDEFILAGFDGLGQTLTGGSADDDGVMPAAAMTAQDHRPIFRVLNRARDVVDPPVDEGGEPAPDDADWSVVDWDASTQETRADVHLDALSDSLVTEPFVPETVAMPDPAQEDQADRDTVADSVAEAPYLDLTQDDGSSDAFMPDGQGDGSDVVVGMAAAAAAAPAADVAAEAEAEALADIASSADVPGWAQDAPEDLMDDDLVEDLAQPVFASARREPVSQSWADLVEAEIHRELADDLGEDVAARAEASDLTPEEIDVLRSLVRSMIRDELAGRLGERITRSVRKLVLMELRQAMDPGLTEHRTRRAGYPDDI